MIFRPEPTHQKIQVLAYQARGPPYYSIGSVLQWAQVVTDDLGFLLSGRYEPVIV
jgi:hypothetical protein